MFADRIELFQAFSMNPLKDRQLRYTRFKSVHKDRLINGVRVKALVGVELGNVCIALNLIHATMLVAELAAHAVWALLRLEERLAILVSLDVLLPWHHHFL